VVRREVLEMLNLNQNICLSSYLDKFDFSQNISFENGCSPVKGVGGTEMKEHEVEMEFFKDIDVEVRNLYIFVIVNEHTVGCYCKTRLFTFFNHITRIIFYFLICKLCFRNPGLLFVPEKFLSSWKRESMPTAQTRNTQLGKL
jgi:hypothetical protein